MPTRLLDWSRDPFAAMFFAAQSGLDILEKELQYKSPDLAKQENIAIWAISTDLINAFSSRKVLHGNEPYDYVSIHVVTPPMTGNPNLTAQQGVFSLVFPETNCADKHDKILKKPLNEVIAGLQEEPETSRRMVMKSLNLEVNEMPTEYFKKFVFPIEKVPKLLTLLHKMRYNPARIYPGYDGATQTIKLLAKLRKVKSQLEKINKAGSKRGRN